MDSRYFEALGALKETVHVSRFHSNPMYIVDVLKGWSLDSSQGMPRQSEMVLISHMLYVKSASCSDRGECVDRLVRGRLQSSLNSSEVESLQRRPWNQRRPPERSGEGEEAWMSRCQLRRSLL